ncbi:DgyrCDS8802 [Dimorphilus gyrociliatus]|uniref:adenosine deaminase n=1 Tax=Dimorphilus gyrociliatus TaxID=2664684 RepID=A0A7I8VV76_9ANNE|nr:DgyrCDS8802 [Dimorphilus gyrociliatus]
MEDSGRKKCAPKVQLHIHLDGSVRVQTVIDLALEYDIPLPTYDVDKLKSLLESYTGSLTKFLEAFKIFAPVYTGKLKALRRIALEFVEDCENCGLWYCEVRYCPFLLTGDSLSVYEVMDTIENALKEGSEKYNVKIKSILSIMLHLPDTAMKTVEIAKSYENVVGIDIAGDENTVPKTGYDARFRKAFEEAKNLNISRTVHAGENGPPWHVEFAIRDLDAQRIGHGYATVKDENVIKLCQQKHIHLETCPLSSRATGSVSGDWKNHPLKKIVKLGISFSVNSDDTIMTGKDVRGDFRVCLDKIGLTRQDLISSVS